MKTITKTQTIKSVAILAALAALMISTTASAASMKWCMKWKTTYVDAGHGEDVFTASSTTYRSATHGYAQVRIASTDALVWSGELDSAGCTPYVTAQSNTQYKIKQGTLASRGARKIYVMPDSNPNTWGGSYVWVNWYYTTAYLLPLNSYTYTKNLDWTSPKANVMPVAGRVLLGYSTYAYPDSTSTYVRTDYDTCSPSGGAWCSGSHVCLLGSGAGAWGDVTTWKYITAHELGHRVSYANAGPTSGSYNHAGAPALCNCDHVQDYGADLHCLQSREPIHAAASEGFAHFFATTMFNSRVENDGKYVYPKEAWDLYGDLWVPVDPPTAWNAYQVTPENFSDRWMERYCSDSMADKGVEMDWLRFFFEMWTTGDYKFTVAELADVWADTSDYYKRWDYLVDTVGDQWGAESDEYYLFYNKGGQAGVRH